jgi:hypothetical protein
MMKHFTFLLALLLLAGCATPFEGIKMRAQSPFIDEAYRKLTLAVTTDGYAIESVVPSRFALATKWREAKPQELSKLQVLPGVVRTEYRLALRMEARGKLYDVFLSPTVRYTMGDGSVREEAAGPMHPLTEKWQGVLKQLLLPEQKEED